jgi:glycosyltransferase involved in cell wall biosynthesis
VINVGLFPPPYGGVSIHLQRLLGRLRVAGADCVLIDLSGVPKQHDGVVGLSWAQALVRLALTKRSIVHFHNFTPRNTFFYWLLSLRHKTILSWHNERFLEELKALPLPGRILATAFLRRVDRIVVDSQTTWLLAEKIIRDSNRLVLIPEFLEPDIGAGATNPKIMRLRENHRYLISSNAFAIAFHKGEDLYGLDLLVELMRRLVQGKHLDAALAFLLPVSDTTPYFRKMQDEVQRHGLSERVLFVTEPLDEAASLWRLSDLVIRATNTDGNSLSVMEALSVGVPVVASDCVDRPEGVITFENRSIDDLEAKVVDVLLRPDEHRRRVAALPPLDHGPRFLALYESMGMRRSS